MNPTRLKANLFTAISLSLSLSPSLASASAQGSGREAICDLNKVCTIQRVLKTDTGELRTLPFKFKYRPAEGDSPTLVYIPGGPGQTSTEIEFEGVVGVPKGYGIILIDPLFLGLNKHPEMNQFKNAVRSEQIAEDIKSALEATRVRNPILYGVSFGTVPATILASKLEKGGSSRKPRAVVLDSTWAVSQPHSAYSEGFMKEWNRLAKELPSEHFKALLTIANQLVSERKVTNDEMGNVFQYFLMARNIQGELRMVSIIKWIAEMAATYPTVAETFILNANQSWKEEMLASINDDVSDLFRKLIICREIALDGQPSGPDFTFNGTLKPAPSLNQCQGFASDSQSLYDSKRYQSSAPFIYLQGEKDPATPKEQALLHAQNQKRASKQIVMVPNGGHSVIDKELRECRTDFWTSLAKERIERNERKEKSVRKASRAFEPCIAKMRPPVVPGE